MAFPVVASSATTTTQDASPGKPSGLAVGDLIFLFLSAAAYVNFDANVSPPDGTWTVVLTSGSSTRAVGIWYKVATSTEVAASTFGSVTGDRTCGATMRVTGADPVSPVILSHATAQGGTSLSTSGISPVLQSLLLNIVVSTNDNNDPVTASSQAVANSNPSWSGAIAISSGVASNMSGNVTVAYANETGGPGSSTGNATASLPVNDNAILAIVSVQPVVYVSDFFGSVFGVFQPILPVSITEFLSATFGVFQASTADIPNLWNNTVKSVLSVFNNTPKP